MRVVHETARRGPNPSFTKATPAALVEALSHPNGWWRDTAQQLLVQRNDKASVVPLKRLAESAPPRSRLHALWTLDGMDSLDPASVMRALRDQSRDVRAPVSVSNAGFAKATRDARGRNRVGVGYDWACGGSCSLARGG